MQAQISISLPALREPGARVLLSATRLRTPVQRRGQRGEGRCAVAVEHPAEAGQNSIRSFAMSTWPEKCFFTSAAHAV